MNHKTETFIFKDKRGKEIKLKSRAYTIDLEESVLIARFGEKTLNEFAETHRLNRRITLSDINDDMPRLLEGSGLEQVDWSKQEKDIYYKVYCFFLEYDSNAQLRVLESYKETLALNLEAMKVLMNSLPQNILQNLNLENTQDKV